MSDFNKVKKRHFADYIIIFNTKKDNKKVVPYKNVLKEVAVFFNSLKKREHRADVERFRRNR